MFDKYNEAIGYWVLPKEEESDDEVKLKLQMGDGTKMRDIMMNPRNRKDKSFLFDKFSSFMVELIKRDYPEVSEQSVKNYVEINSMMLFEEAQVVFRFATRESLEKAKSAGLKDLKKLIEDD